MTLDRDALIELYTAMVRIRSFEDTTKELYLQDQVRGTIHVSQGQEAVAAGACFALRSDDYVLTTHRGHGHCIAKGVSPKALLAEILGRATGCCHGRAGSLHAFDASVGVLGAAAVVGAGIPIATGVGLGIRMLGEDRVVLNFFGDGASNQGTFHEAINLGAVWKLPVIYVCENNQIADTTPFRETIAIESIADRAAGYGIPGKVVDGNDVEAVHAAVARAAERARAGEGPTLIECKTYRWEGHHIGDPCLWRGKGELETWKDKCPIKRLRDKLVVEQKVAQEKLDEIDRRVREEIEAAAAFALESPQPDPQTVSDFVY